jgi:hypothetical protein
VPFLAILAADEIGVAVDSQSDLCHGDLLPG